MSERTPYGARRLKAKVLAILDERIAACRAAEDRYANGKSGLTGEAQSRAEATERSARFEAELIRERIMALPAAGRIHANSKGDAP